MFVVADAKQALAWADLTYAIDLNAMNSSVTPLNYLVQSDRPFKWLNWDADRVKEMIKGSYLFGDDKGRIIQDPESLRASSIRQASAWAMWAMLRDDVVTQLNSSDHNPAIRVGISPQDSWDLDTPEMLKYYVKGGKNSHGQARLHLLERQLGSLPAVQRSRGLHDRARQHGYRDHAARRTVRQ